MEAHPRVLAWHFGEKYRPSKRNEVVELSDSDEELNGASYFDT